jgi:hypothetical protein
MEETIHINRRVIEKCLEGDMKAQFRLYQQYSQAMYNIALRFLNDKMDAEDVLQESFVTAFQSLGRTPKQGCLRELAQADRDQQLHQPAEETKMRFEEIDEYKHGQEDAWGGGPCPAGSGTWFIRPSKSCLPRDEPYWCCVHWKGIATKKLQKHWE